MFSRAGKSTNSLYLAFQDKDKLKYVQSKVGSNLNPNGSFSAAELESHAIAAQIETMTNYMNIEDQTSKAKILG